MQENVISKIYIDGEFVTPHGTELADLFNPATGKVIGHVRLADEVDTEAAVAAAKRALPAWSATSKQERIDALRRLQAAVAAKGTKFRSRSSWSTAGRCATRIWSIRPPVRSPT